MSVKSRIVSIALAKVGKKDWRYDAEKDNFGKNTNKCNKFVYDVLVEAGVTPDPVVPHTFWRTRAPTAAEWANPNITIPNWSVVATPEPGDVVAEAHAYSDATGHVGIVVAVSPNGETVSASALQGGDIVKNDWGFRSDNKPTFKRYMG